MRRPQAATVPDGSGFQAGTALIGLVAVATLMTALTTAEGVLYRASRGDEIALVTLAGGRLADWYTCAVLIPPLYWVTCRWPIEQPGWRLPVAVHLAASACASVLKYVLYVPLRTVIDPGYDAGVLDAISADFLGKLMFFWAAIGILHAIFFYRRGQSQARQAIGLTAQSAHAHRGDGGDRLLAIGKKGFPLVAVEEIDWIEAQGNYALIHAGDRRHLIRETMTALGERLDPVAFVRVHRSAIVAVAAIREVEPAPKGRYRLSLRNGATLSTGRSFRNRVRDLLP
ncbi:MAG TPA: LytTR family DNA-binding domain-containing protein [Allosphingosinicella sp.]|jgi:hypothetical protein